METRINEVLNNKQENYILPFFWQHGEDENTLRNYVKTINNMGISALCLESRPHPDFVGPKWWHDFDIIINEAKKRKMKIWILDDSHFPTGYANGAVEHADKRLKKWNIYHMTVDLVGPSSSRIDIESLLGNLGIGFPLTPNSSLANEKKLLSAVLYKRADDFSDVLTEDCIPLTDSIVNGLLPVQVPDGFYRLFIIYKAMNTGLANNNYINFLQEESVKLLLDTVYEPHYQRYSDEFGKTIAGFFSDEPGFYNCIDQLYNFDAIVGKTQMPLPWSDELETLFLSDGVTYDNLALLWYDSSTEKHSILRYRYMNLVTKLYEKNFSVQLGTWCRNHHVEYIGHILEDNNSSSRLGPSAGHYFRAMTGQDMSGIDVVTSQVIPGRTNIHTTNASYNTKSDGEFYHYALAKLGASNAHLDPLKKGRAMCEIFGNFGWAEGLELMKWLTDFMLVRGINTFVPHAFSPKAFPDPDCPPHFYAHGNNMQSPYMKYLFNYMNRVSHILNGGKSCSKVGILYHGEAEWAGEAMLFQKPGRICLENQIDYDVIPADLLNNPDTICSNLTSTKELSLGSLQLKYLIIPYAQKLPYHLLKSISLLAQMDFPVIFIDDFPTEACEGTSVIKQLNILQSKAYCTKLSQLTDILNDDSLPIISFASSKKYKDLRAYQYQGDHYQCIMLMNESPSNAIQEKIRFSSAKPILEYDAYKNELHYPYISDELYFIHLEPGESIIFLADIDESKFTDILPAKTSVKMRKEISEPAFLSFSSVLDDGKFKPFGFLETFKDLSLEDEFLNFHGTLRYELDFQYDSSTFSAKSLYIDSVHEVVDLSLNGHKISVSISAPYRFEIAKYLHEGNNHLVIDNITTVFPFIKDHSSINTGLHPMGIYGKVWLENY